MGFVLIYKELSLTHVAYFSFHFSRDRKRKGDKGARVSKMGVFQVSKTLISSKYFFSPLIFW